VVEQSDAPDEEGWKALEDYLEKRCKIVEPIKRPQKKTH